MPWRPARFIREQTPDARPLPVHLREALEELGTTFIKVGQILSTHADLLPTGYLAELSKLQDAGPTVEFEAIRDVIEAELGRPIGELFAEFDPVPLASASIAQVHAATLSDGREIVVKVERPGVREQVELDLDILYELSRRFVHRLPDNGFVDLEGLLEEFARSIRSELDFTREGRNSDLFRKVFQDDPTIHVPEIHWALTTRRVITQERLHGIRLDDEAGLAAGGFDRHELALLCTKLMFGPMFERGTYHADLHPGNMLVLDDGTLGVIDFGMIGRLDEITRDCILRFLLGALDGDADAVMDALERLGLPVRPLDQRRFRQDISYLVDLYREQSLSDISLTDVGDQVLGLLRRYKMRMPPQLAPMLRSIMIVEGVGRRLDPSYVATAAIEPHVRRALAQRARPDYLGKQLAKSAISGAQLGLGLPIRIDRLLGRFERGTAELGWRPEGFEPVLARLDAMVNRLALSVLASAFVIGIAVLLLYPMEGWPAHVVLVLLVIGLLTVLMIGGMLAIDLLRRRGR